MIIPIVHCFNDNYAAPAGVAFLSMLEHARNDDEYHIYACHSDITHEHQRQLMEIVGRFKNAKLEFVDMHNAYEEEFESLNTKGHYSKELIYKMVVPRLFPQYDRMIIADVDCVYQDDIGQIYRLCEENDGDYMAGVELLHSNKCNWLLDVFHIYDDQYTQEEQRVLKLGLNAGFMIFNLKKMREEDLTSKFLAYFKANVHRLKQPEQDTIHICCYPKIQSLPTRTMICSYLYTVLEEDEKRVWQSALDNPIQLHYAAKEKPWNTPSSTKSNIWFSYLLRTSFYDEVMGKLDQYERRTKWKLFGIPILKIYAYGDVKNVRFLNAIKLKGCK